MTRCAFRYLVITPCDPTAAQASERLIALGAAEKAAAASAREADLLRRRLEVKQAHAEEVGEERDAAAARVHALQAQLAKQACNRS